MCLAGEDSSVSTPTSQGEGARTPGDNQESVRSGVRPRLQRQMAQSRKTFRFRKSKHGQTEVIVMDYADDCVHSLMIMMYQMIRFLFHVIVRLPKDLFF